MHCVVTCGGCVGACAGVGIGAGCLDVFAAAVGVVVHETLLLLLPLLL